MILSLKRIINAIVPYFFLALLVTVFYQHLSTLQHFLFSQFAQNAVFSRPIFVLFAAMGFLVKAFILWVWAALNVVIIDLARDRNADMSLRAVVIKSNKFYFVYIAYYVMQFFLPYKALAGVWMLLFLFFYFLKDIRTQRRYTYLHYFFSIIFCLGANFAALYSASFYLIRLVELLTWILLCVLFAGKPVKQESRIIIINPLWSGVLGTLAAWISCRFPPFFAALLSCTSEDYTVRLNNASFWNRYTIMPGDLVAISCFSSNAYKAYRIAKDAKSRGAFVAMGGPHVSAFVAEALGFCDSVVVGEAESVWADLLDDYRQKKLKTVYRGCFAQDNISSVYRQIDKLPLYQAKSYVESTRGCKFSCEHCTIPFVSGTAIRHANVEKLLAHIKRLSEKYKHITFLDNNIYSNPEYARVLFKGLKELNITWDAGISIDIASNEEDLKLAYESGGRNFLIGYELVEAQQSTHKQGKFAYMNRYLELTKRIKSYGIKLKAGFIHGFDNCDLNYTLALVLFVAKINVSWSLLFLLTPFPGSRLYDRFLADDRISVLNWKKYDTHYCTFVPLSRSPILFRMGFDLTRFIVTFVLSAAGRVMLLLIVLYFVFFYR